jgi:hypothetical protein
MKTALPLLLAMTQWRDDLPGGCARHEDTAIARLVIGNFDL